MTHPIPTDPGRAGPQTSRCSHGPRLRGTPLTAVRRPDGTAALRRTALTGLVTVACLALAIGCVDQARAQAENLPVGRLHASVQTDLQEQLGAFQIATATYVRIDKVDDKVVDKVYVVGAYHSLVGSRNLGLFVDGFAEYALTPSAKLPVYYDRAEDIFFAELPNAADVPENDRPAIRAIRARAWPLAQTDPGIGTSSVAIGNPEVRIADVVAFTANNIAYNCTVSEYGRAQTRIPKLVALGDPDLMSLAQNRKRMFVESLSVNQGFSGGPLLSRGAPREVQGIVVAGTRHVAPGRFAVICPAAIVGKLITNIIKSPGSISPTHQGAIAQRLETIDWNDDRKKSPYVLSQFSAVREEIFSDKQIDQDEYERKFKHLFTKPQSSRIVFTKCTFNRVDFGDVMLEFVVFQDCTFNNITTEPGKADPVPHEPFGAAIVTGCSFENCSYSRPPAKFYLGLRSLRDVNNKTLVAGAPNRRPGRPDDGSGELFKYFNSTGAPPAPGPAPAALAGADPAAKAGATDGLGGALPDPTEDARDPKTMTDFRKQLEEAITRSDATSPESPRGLGHFRRILEPHMTRHALVLAQIYLQFASAQLDAPAANAARFGEVKNYLNKADNLLAQTDATNFDVDELQVHQRLVERHREITVAWLAALSGGAVSGGPGTGPAGPAGPAGPVGPGTNGENGAPLDRPAPVPPATWEYYPCPVSASPRGCRPLFFRRCR